MTSRLRPWFTKTQNYLAVIAVILAIAPGLRGQSAPKDENRQLTENETKMLPTVRVFILAGQSNMEGQGVVDLDHPKHYNSGKGTLVKLMQDPARNERYRHLKNDQGKWVVRDDVMIRFRTAQRLKKGGLGIGFAGYDDLHHFGPELQFGHIVGDAFEEPVLLIKTAWGGKSLFRDFRPPSSGGEVGTYYKKMIAEVREALDSYQDDFPSLEGRTAELSGFVWFQGWNDMVDENGRKEYSKNLVNLIQDVRKEFGSPILPVVVGELGNDGETNNAAMNELRTAQRNGSNDPRFFGSVGFVPTTEFARPANESPNVTHGHHWYGNAESYFLIGNALGNRMLEILGEKQTPKKRVLILGDSISIGYTAHVREILKEDAIVIRPMRNLKGAENCAGTDRGITEIDRWLKLCGGNWDVVHFNFGLHDLKHVQPETGKNSNDPKHPQQSNPQDYERQLRAIVAKIKSTGAKLIFATTTPVPEGVRPYRAPEYPEIYNEIASRIMKENNIEINDLFSFANDRLEEIQQPANVHFNKPGSKALGKVVAETIRKAFDD